MIVNVYVEETPNPATRKFMVNKLLINGSVDYPTKEAAEKSPFATELFKFDFVTGVFFASNFATITKAENADWDDIEPLLKAFIKGAVESELEVSAATDADIPEFTGTDTEKKIQQILHDYVKPAVEQDGGAIAYKSFDNGVVTVELRGSCSGCPSSVITLKSGIQNLLQRMVPEVTDVVSEAM